MSILPHGGATVSSTTKLSDVVTYGQPYGFSAFSPFAAEPYGVSRWTSAVFSGLLKRSSANNRDWAPDLAKTMPQISDDGLTYTFELRDHLYFSNGKSLTAEDVDVSFRLAIAPAINKLDYGKYVGFVDNNSLTVISNSTLSIGLSHKFAFPYGLMSFPIVPKDFVLPYLDCVISGKNCDFNRKDGSRSISDGPYMISSLTSDSVKLAKNPYWYDVHNVKTDNLVFITIPTKDEAISALSNGSINIMDSRYGPGLNELKGISGIKQTFVGDPVTFEMAVNNLNPYFGTGMQIPKTLAEGPSNKTLGFENARMLRHAMSSAMDRYTAVEQIMEGLAEPAATNMPSASLGWDPTVKPNAFNVTHAQEIMTGLGFNYTELGTPDGTGSYSKFFFNVTILAPDSIEPVYQFPPLYVAELAKLGIGVIQYVTISWNDITSRVFHVGLTHQGFTDGGYDMLFLQRSWGLDWNPGAMYSSNGSCSTGDCSNIYNFDLGENMTKLAQHIRDYLNELDFDTRRDKLSLVQQDISHYLPTLGVLYPQSHWSWTDDVLGIDTLLLSVGQQEWNLVYRTGFNNCIDCGYTPKPNGSSWNFETVFFTLIIVLTFSVLFGPNFFKKKGQE